MSDEGTEVVKASPSQENWFKKNATGLLVGVLVTVIGGVILYAAKEQIWPSDPSVEVTVRASPHYALKTNGGEGKYASVWDMTVVNNADKVAKDVILQVPFEGVARVKLPRQAEKEITVGEAGVALGAMRAGDVATVMIWSPATVEEVKAERLRVTHVDGPGVVMMHGHLSGWWRVLSGGAVICLVVLLVLLFFMRRQLVAFQEEVDELFESLLKEEIHPLEQRVRGGLGDSEKTTSNSHGMSISNMAKMFSDVVSFLDEMKEELRRGEGEWRTWDEDSHDEFLYDLRTRVEERGFIYRNMYQKVSDAFPDIDVPALGDIQGIEAYRSSLRTQLGDTIESIDKRQASSQDEEA